MGAGAVVVVMGEVVAVFKWFGVGLGRRSSYSNRLVLMLFSIMVVVVVVAATMVEELK